MYVELVGDLCLFKYPHLLVALPICSGDSAFANACYESCSKQPIPSSPAASSASVHLSQLSLVIVSRPLWLRHFFHFLLL